MEPSLLVTSLGYGQAVIVAGAAPQGQPPPLWLQATEDDGAMLIGHAVYDPRSRGWVVRVDAELFGAEPTSPSRSLVTLGETADRSQAALQLMGAARVISRRQ